MCSQSWTSSERRVSDFSPARWSCEHMRFKKEQLCVNAVMAAVMYDVRSSTSGVVQGASYQNTRDYFYESRLKSIARTQGHFESCKAVKRKDETCRLEMAGKGRGIP